MTISLSDLLVKPFVLAALALTAAVPLRAQEPVPDAGASRVHVVRPGDTLWDLARLYLGDSFLWPEIFRLNTETVEDPAWIYPAERLRLPGGATGAEVAVEETGEPERTTFFGGEAAPREPMATVRPAGTASVPVLAPGDFFRAALLASEGEVAPVGTVVEQLSPGVIPTEIPPLVSLYDRVFVALVAPASVRVGDRLHLLRPGREVEPFGRVYEPTGMATVEAIDGNVATTVVDQLFDVVSIGDRALPAPRFPVVAGVRPVPRDGVRGRIIAFPTPQPLVSTQDFAFLDLGEEAGLEAGDELVAFLPPEDRRWGTRPEVPIAVLQVVRVTDRTASARVTDLRYPALEPGIPVRLVRKMP